MNSNEKKFSLEECEQYLNNKYDGNFTFSRAADESQPTASLMKVYYRSDKYPDSEVYVVAEKNGDTISYSDNYIAVKYEDDTRTLYTKAAEEVYGKCRVLYEISPAVLDDSFSDSTAVSEYTGMRMSCLNFTVFLEPGRDESDREEKLHELYTKLCDNGFVCKTDVYYTTEDEAFSSYNGTDIHLNGKGWYTQHGRLWIDDGFSLSKESWEG